MLTLLAMSAGAWSPSAHAKPRPSLVVSLQANGEWIPGQLLDITANVNAHAGFERVEVVLELVDGATLVSGTPSWAGAMRAGQQREFQFVVNTPQSGLGAIRLIASGGHEDGDSHYRAQAELSPPAAIKAKAALTEHRRIERQGRTVREYRLP